MALGKSIFKYKKIIMLTLVLIAVIICVFATYITEYNVNKVTREEVLTTEMTKNYKSSEEFLNNFDEFKIYLLSNNLKEPSTDENGNIDYGRWTFTVSTIANENSQIKNKFDITIGLGANWIKYISKTAHKRGVTIGNETTIEISNIDKIFPAKGDLWFVNVDGPTLYVLVEWSEKNNSQYYTYLEYEFEDYFVKSSK